MRSIELIGRKNCNGNGKKKNLLMIQSPISSYQILIQYEKYIRHLINTIRYIYIKNHTMDQYKKKIIKIQPIFSYFPHCASVQMPIQSKKITLSLPPVEHTYISIEKIIQLLDLVSQEESLRPLPPPFRRWPDFYSIEDVLSIKSFTK